MDFPSGFEMKVDTDDGNAQDHSRQHTNVGVYI
jgi:hypothetical protein